MSTLWNRGRITLISDSKQIEDAALYGLLSLLPSLEGDGRTVYRCDEVPECVESVREKPLVALLDDEDGILEVLGRELRSEGYDVLTFSYKDDFLCHVKHRPDAVPDLVISDIKSPRMDGLEFLRRFKSDQRFQPIPVIILSGNIPGRSDEACRLGAFKCISKPYDLNDLLSAVQEAQLLQK